MKKNHPSRWSKSGAVRWPSNCQDPIQVTWEREHHRWKTLVWWQQPRNKSVSHKQRAESPTSTVLPLLPSHFSPFFPHFSPVFGPLQVCLGSSVLRSQSLTVESPLPLASLVESGEKATHSTACGDRSLQKRGFTWAWLILYAHRVYHRHPVFRGFHTHTHM